MSAVWIITDGKPGHYNQSLGLALALADLMPELQVKTLPVMAMRQLFSLGLGLSLPENVEIVLRQAPPQLILAAGHATHLSLLLLGWRLKVKTVVLMKPSLPTRLFNLCLIPAHDRPQPAKNIIETQGALNPMRPKEKKAGTGLILIGGPSKHHGWDEENLLSQLQSLVFRNARQWMLTSSRRTPATTLKRLKKELQGVKFVPHTETPQGWLAEHLATAEQAWVTADSVSMVYEALTAGCEVGVLDVPQQAKNRLTQGLQDLADESIITFFARWTGDALHKPDRNFDEAGRCAQQILTRGWL